MPSRLTAIPIIQHFFSLDGENVGTRAARLIALQPLPRMTSWGGEAFILSPGATLAFDFLGDKLPFSLSPTVVWNYSGKAPGLNATAKRPRAAKHGLERLGTRGRSLKL